MFELSASSLPKIVVTGASGFLGAHLCQLLSRDYDVVAVSHSQPLPESLASFRVRMDLSDRPLVEAMLDNMRPVALIHAAALADPNTCEREPERSLALNVEVTRQLARSCAARNIKLVFTSTDLVFDGRQGHYAETDPVNPICIYGEHKALAEELVRELHPSSVIVRLPWMFGPGLIKTSALQSWCGQLRQGEKIRAFNDEYRSAVSYTVAAGGILQCLLQTQAETLHLGGIETVTRYHLLHRLAGLLGIDEEQVEAQSQRDVIMPARRPPDASLDSRKARSLGYKTPFLTDMLKQALSVL